MSTQKKKIRETFREAVFSRDNYTCLVCKTKYVHQQLDAHHITDRNEMPNGGYVPENGITVCHPCHMKVEQFHISGGTKWEAGLHPDDLYRLIKSNYELAFTKSEQL